MYAEASAQFFGQGALKAVQSAYVEEFLRLGKN